MVVGPVLGGEGRIGRVRGVEWECTGSIDASIRVWRETGERKRGYEPG